MTEFDCDLFDEIKPILRSHQSGMVASYQLLEAFETAHADGKTNSVFHFSEERMFHVKNFDYTIHINSSHSFSKPPVLKDATQGNIAKTDAMKNKALEQIISFAQNCEDALDLIDLMQYRRVTYESLPILNVSRTIRNMVKSRVCRQIQYG